MYFEEVDEVLREATEQGVDKKRIKSAAQIADCQAVWRLGAIMPTHGGLGEVNPHKRRVIFYQAPGKEFFQEAQKKIKTIIEELRENLGLNPK